MFARHPTPHAWLLVGAVALGLALAGWTGCAGDVRPAGRLPVGVTTVSFLEQPSGRPLTCEVWYPAPDTSVEVEQHYGGAYLGRAARDAPVREGGRYALLVLSHGLRGTRFDLSWLAEGLAAEGFIVVAVDHPGSDATTYVESEAPKLWVRSHTLSAVLDNMLQSRFKPFIDKTRIAAAGHSLGGSTVLVLGGARIDPQRFAHRFPESAPSPTGSLRDRRIRAVLAVAPGTAQVFTEDGIKGMDLPALIISGTADWMTPEPQNAGFYAGSLQHTEWHSIANAGHYTFGPQCTLYGHIRARHICNDRLGVDRGAAHEQVVSWARAFLRRNL